MRRSAGSGIRHAVSGQHGPAERIHGPRFSLATEFSGVAKALEYVFEEHGALRLIDLWCVDPRQAFVERVFDGKPHLRAGLRLLPPIQHQRGMDSSSK